MKTGATKQNTALRKGTTAAFIRSPASIPTRFETILNPNDRERKGFASSALRFHEAWEDTPGPGAYIAPSSSISTKSQESMSKKGVSALAAREKRWYEVGFPTFNPPPPGAYYDQQTTLLKKSNHVSAAFAKPVFDSCLEDNVLAKQSRLPGPGAYDVTSYGSISQKQHVAGSAAFRSSQPRLKSPRSSSANQDVSAKSAPVERLPSPSTSASTTRSPVSSPKHHRQASPTADMDTHAGSVKNKMPSAAFRSGTQRDREALRGLPLENPGPGAYDAQSKPVDRSHLPPRRPGLPTNPHHMSPAFAANVDRFGRSVVAVERESEKVVGPDPGSYYHPQEIERRSISSSFFMSSTPKAGEEPVHKSKPVRVPGPAYYNPAVPSKKTFHLNVNSQWSR